MADMQVEYIFQRQLIMQFNIKMQTFPEKDSPSKIYKIKLHEKDIKVEINYGPPHLNKENKNYNGIHPPSTKQQQPIIVLTNKKKSLAAKTNTREAILTTRQKQFYANSFQESKNALEKYEQFHNSLAEGKTQARLKVYSHSKIQILCDDKSHNGLVPIRNLIISNTKREASPKPIMKIRLYSNQKHTDRIQSSITRDKIKSAIQQQQRQQQTKREVQQSMRTPSRSRKYKLQVTTSKSRGKNDSAISYRQQLSKQIRSIQLKNYNNQLSDPNQSLPLHSLSLE